MLMQSLTYMQAMPEYLDLLLPLGKRALAQDIYANCFHQRTYLSDLTQTLAIPDRNWSGYQFQMCYSLKSVERSETQPSWPWSIRHCAVHHSFDVLNARSSWVIVKGNRLMEKRITSATSSRSPPEFSSYSTIDRAFAAALASHTILTDWAGENWRWYVNFLEERFEDMTQGVISIDTDIIPTKTMDTAEDPTMFSQANIQLPKPSIKSGSFFTRGFSFSSRRIVTTPTLQMKPVPALRYHTDARSGKRQPLPPGRSIDTAENAQRPTSQQHAYGQRQFKFQHIQEIQNLEDSANETILVLRSNLNVCRQISRFYQSLVDNHELPGDVLEKKISGDLIIFQRKIEGVSNQMNGQIVAVEALVRLIADRKALVQSQHRFGCIIIS